MVNIMQTLSLGIASFPAIIKQNCIYVDKTMLLFELLKTRRPFFLSRPRRFGKTLLVDTLENILRGNRELFKGFWIYNSDYDWVPKPVIHLSLDATPTDSIKQFESDIITDIFDIAKSENIILSGTSLPRIFKSLIDMLYEKYALPVSILIDEYDAPILSQLDNPAQAEKIRKRLQLFYGVLKQKEKIRGFSFVTGVTRFVKTSIFSGLNNLIDLTLNKKYATICGFTLEELDSFFAEHLEAMLANFKARGVLPQVLTPEATAVDLRRLILEWYDGYSWDGETRVLNPWAILNA
jgi:hypothetical protein